MHGPIQSSLASDRNLAQEGSGLTSQLHHSLPTAALAHVQHALQRWQSVQQNHGAIRPAIRSVTIVVHWLQKQHTCLPNGSARLGTSPKQTFIISGPGQATGWQVPCSVAKRPVYSLLAGGAHFTYRLLTANMMAALHGYPSTDMHMQVIAKGPLQSVIDSGVSDTPCHVHQSLSRGSPEQCLLS